ncbi:MAG: preprotein translocase subunit SecG [Candidatus Saganbacteria bacterium]|nr:preprotein translocase subunit SecG [Candidatus Saganbacteria bacterium]
MKSLLLAVQIISALGLIITVLLHSAKGEGLGGIGGTAHVFGSQKGLEEGLDRLTAGLAVTFILVSLIINFI